MVIRILKICMLSDNKKNPILSNSINQIQYSKEDKYWNYFWTETSAMLIHKIELFAVLPSWQSCFVGCLVLIQGITVMVLLTLFILRDNSSKWYCQLGHSPGWRSKQSKNPIWHQIKKALKQMFKCDGWKGKHMVVHGGIHYYNFSWDW